MSYGIHPYAIRFHALFEANTKNLGGYELEELVTRLGGRFQSNMYWSAMRISWFDMVDDALEKAGADVKLSQHFFSPPPIPFTRPDDFPMIGHVKPDEVEPLAAALAAVKLEGQEEESVNEVIGWLKGLRPGEGLVTFYY
jgi:hypothetical protein